MLKEHLDAIYNNVLVVNNKVLLGIWTSFRPMLPVPNCWLNQMFWSFHPFLLILDCFLVIFIQKIEKHL